MNRKNCLALALALLMALVLSGCGLGGGSAPETPAQAEPQPDPEYPVVVGGIEIGFRPARVVSLAPSLTEKIYDLGHRDRLVGISDHQGDYPASLAGLPALGIATMPDIEGILAQNPDLVFSVSELPADAMEALERRDIPLIIMPSYAHSMAELEEIYISLSTALDGRTTGQIKGERFIRDFNSRIDEIAAGAAGYGPVNAVYLRALDFTMATGDTLEGELMARLGFVNIAAGQTGWVFDPEEAAGEGRALFTSIEMIFLDERYVSMEALEQSTFWQGLPSVINDRYTKIDSQVFERQSLRLLDQLAVMAEAIQLKMDN